MGCNCGNKQGILYKERPKVKIIKKAPTTDKVEDKTEEKVNE